MPIDYQNALESAIKGKTPFSENDLRLQIDSSVNEVFGFLQSVIFWIEQAQQPTLAPMVLAMAGALIAELAQKNNRNHRHKLVENTQFLSNLVVTEIDGSEEYDFNFINFLAATEMATFRTEFWSNVTP